MTEGGGGKKNEKHFAITLALVNDVDVPMSDKCNVNNIQEERMAPRSNCQP
jgi:hypothetical protein